MFWKLNIDGAQSYALVREPIAFHTKRNTFMIRIKCFIIVYILWQSNTISLNSAKIIHFIKHSKTMKSTFHQFSQVQSISLRRKSFVVLWHDIEYFLLPQQHYLWRWATSHDLRLATFDTWSGGVQFRKAEMEETTIVFCFSIVAVVRVASGPRQTIWSIYWQFSDKV